MCPVLFQKIKKNIILSYSWGINLFSLRGVYRNKAVSVKLAKMKLPRAPQMVMKAQLRQ